MNDQPTALRLADALGYLEATGHCSDSVSLTDRSEAIADAAAAELRRLHAQRDALLEALKTIADGPWPDDVISPIDQTRFDERVARAAIAKAEREGQA